MLLVSDDIGLTNGRGQLKPAILHTIMLNDATITSISIIIISASGTPYLAGKQKRNLVMRQLPRAMDLYGVDVYEMVLR